MLATFRNALVTTALGVAGCHIPSQGDTGETGAPALIPTEQSVEAAQMTKPPVPEYPGSPGPAGYIGLGLAAAIGSLAVSRTLWRVSRLHQADADFTLQTISLRTNVEKFAGRARYADVDLLRNRMEGVEFHASWGCFAHGLSKDLLDAALITWTWDSLRGQWLDTSVIEGFRSDAQSMSSHLNYEIGFEQVRQDIADLESDLKYHDAFHIAPGIDAESFYRDELAPLVINGVIPTLKGTTHLSVRPMTSDEKREHGLSQSQNGSFVIELHAKGSVQGWYLGWDDRVPEAASRIAIRVNADGSKKAWEVVKEWRRPAKYQAVDPNPGRRTFRQAEEARLNSYTRDEL